MACKAVRMNAYSLDLRLKVLDAVDCGIPRKVVVRTFGVSMPTLESYLRRRRRTGSLTSRPSPGVRPQSALLSRRGGLCGAARRERRRHPTAPLQAMGGQAGSEGLRLHHQQGSAQAGLKFQKSRWEPPSETKRREVLGESGLSPSFRKGLCSWTNAPPTSPSPGSTPLAPKGERAFGRAPRSWGKNVSPIAALSTERATAEMSIEEATDGAAL